MTSLEYFLLKQIYAKGQHPLQPNSDCYVYDYEIIHYPLLKILLEECPDFTAALLGFPAVPSKVEVTIQPEKGAIDLLIQADENPPHYVEVKLWAPLQEYQFNDQISLIKRKDAKGLYVLLAKSTVGWSPSKIAVQSDNCCQMIGSEEIMAALNALKAFSSQEVAEVAEAFKKVLADLERRW